jgi:hypothetical protein
MNPSRRHLSFLFAALMAFSLGALPQRASAATAEDLNKDANQALTALYARNPAASDIAK